MSMNAFAGARRLWEALPPARPPSPSPPVPPAAIGDERRELLDRIVFAVNSSLDLDEVLEQLASLALEALPADRASIFLLDRSGTRVLPAAYVARPEIARLLDGDELADVPFFEDMPPIDLKANSSRWQAFCRGRAFMLPDLAASPLVPSWVVEDFGARSAVILPLLAPDEPLGVLALDWMTLVDEVDEGDLTFVEAIGAYASLAIRNARLHEGLTEKARSLERLVEIASALNSSRSVREVLDLACRRFEELLGSSHCSVNLIEEDAPDGLRAIADRGAPGRGGRAGTTPEAVGDLVGRWTESAEPLVYPAPTGGTSSDSPDAHGSVVLFPLLSSGRVRSFVLTEFPSPEPPGAERIELGQALAGLSAAAMERAELYESLEEQLGQTAVLYGLSEAVSGTSDLPSALDALNNLLGRWRGFRVQSMSVVDERVRDAIGASAPVGAEMEAVRSWRAQLPDGRSRLRPLVIPEAVLVPVVLRDQVLGVLRARLEHRPPDEGDEELLVAIGSACAEAVHTLALRRDVAEREQRLAIAAERERIAQDLHDSVGQLITGLGMRLVSYAQEIGDPQWQGRLQELVDTTEEGSRQIREAIDSLLFVQVQRQGLVPSLRDLAKTFEATSGITTSLRVRGEVVPLAGAREDALFRVAHEALTNARRHARTATVSMTLAYTPEEVRLSVRDRGIGLGSGDPLRSGRGHFGLRGIRRRVEEVDGDLIVADARPGAVVEARLPVSARA